MVFGPNDSPRQAPGLPQTPHFTCLPPMSPPVPHNTMTPLRHTKGRCSNMLSEEVESGPRWGSIGKGLCLCKSPFKLWEDDKAADRRDACYQFCFSTLFRSYLAIAFHSSSPHVYTEAPRPWGHVNQHLGSSTWPILIMSPVSAFDTARPILIRHRGTGYGPCQPTTTVEHSFEPSLD